MREEQKLAATTGSRHYKRVVAGEGIEALAEAINGEIHAEAILPGWSRDLQREWLGSYEFDGWMTDFKAKGHQVWRLGMKKHAGRLPWLMEAELTNGRTWHIYVDSHTGDIYRQALIDGDGNETIALEFGDFRDVGDYRFPHEIRFFDGTELLATDRFERISVSTTKDRVATAAQ